MRAKARWVLMAAGVAAVGFGALVLSTVDTAESRPVAPIRLPAVPEDEAPEARRATPRTGIGSDHRQRRRRDADDRRDAAETQPSPRNRPERSVPAPAAEPPAPPPPAPPPPPPADDDRDDDDDDDDHGDGNDDDGGGDDDDDGGDD